MSQSKKIAPDGYHTVMPYLVVPGVAHLIKFLREAFGAEEIVRVPRQDGSIMHAAVRIGDSMVEMGEPTGEWTPRPGNLHLYVRDADEVYQAAVEAGAQSLYTPRDMDYGDREAGVKDPSGNHWYIGTHKAGTHFVPAGLRNVTPGLSVKGAAEFLAFLHKAFSADIMYKQQGPDGSIGHAKVRLGDSVLECSEAHGVWGPRPMSLHFYVPDADAGYRAAISAGAKSLSEPKDQPYGERSGGVIDSWGNHWYIATLLEDPMVEEPRSRTAAQAESVK